MKYTSFVIGCLLAVGMLTMTACGASGTASETTTASASVTTLQTENEANATVAGGTVAVPESFPFERVRFEGEGHAKETLEAYLTEHHENLLATMHNHGISESEDLKILPMPIYAINLRTGTVNLDAHYLPVMEDNAMIGAARVSAREGLSVSARTAELSWMSVVDRYLKNNLAERYLLAECYTSEGTYFCLISSQNEIIYLVRPEGGVDLPFEEGVDYYSKLYDERLFLSYDRIHTEKKPISAILYRIPPDTVYYFTETEILVAKFPGEEIDLDDPMATEGVTVIETRAHQSMSKYENACTGLQKAPLNLSVPQMPGDEDRLMVKNGKSTVIVYYEDGTYSFLQAYGDEDPQYGMLFAALSFMLARPM